MGRPRRIHYPGAFYHLFSRGNNQERIFFDDYDKEFFLDRLRVAKERYQFKLFSYSLMPNHFHQYLQVGDVPLAKIMQSVLTSYTKTINEKYGRSGHIFQGRYSSILVDSDNYSLAVVRYIHLNAVKAGLVNSPGDYRWDSHRVYLGLANDDLVDREFILSQFSEDLRKAKRLYQDFINRGLEADIDKKTVKRKGILLLGKDRWIKEILESVPDID